MNPRIEHAFSDELERLGAFERTKSVARKVALPLALAGSATGGAALEKATGLPSAAAISVAKEVKKPHRILGNRSVAELANPLTWAKDLRSAAKRHGIIKKKKPKKHVPYRTFRR